MMYRRFIAIVLASAVAVTGLSSAPARADGDDVLKILGGLAAIAAIGAAIDKYDDRNDRYAPGYGYYSNGKRHHGHKRHHHHKRFGKHRHKHHGKHYNNHRRHDRYDHDRYAERYPDRKHRDLPRRVKRKLLPVACRVPARNKHGRFIAFPSFCLNSKFRYANALPQNCTTRAKLFNNNKRYKVYTEVCLRQYGYTVGAY